MSITRKLNRRSFLKTSAVALGGLAMPSIVHAQQREMVIAGYGGLYEEASKAAFYDPFTKATGVRIKQVSPGFQMYAQLRLQVQNNNPEVDIYNLGSELMLRAGKEGLLAPINLNVVNTRKLYPKAVNEFGVAMDMYGIGRSYNTETYSKGKQPKSYAEYWDIARFPGRRTAPGFSARDNLEVALMADGVPLDKLYPLDIERAFKTLEKVKPHTTWYRIGGQLTQLFADKAVVLGYGYLGRVNVLARSGLPVATSINQAIYSFTNWNVSKVSLNKDIAMEFINFASQAEQQAKRSILYPEGPINRDAWAMIPEYLHPTVPKYDAPNVVFRDDAWWEANGAPLEERWKLWLAS